MNSKFARFLACAAVCFLSLSLAVPEERYRLETDAKGAPLFTQILSWDPVEYAQGYRVEIIDATKKVILQDMSETNELTVHLGAGEYQYRITVFNLLGKPEVTGKWKTFTVRKAEYPEITSVEPRMLYLDARKFVFSVYGTNLFTAASVALVDPETGAEVYEATVLDSSVAGSLIVELPAEILEEGTFRVRVRNPGGLLAEDNSVFSILVRKSYEFHASAGWTPLVPLYDSWYTDIWDDGIYLSGGSIHFSWGFIRKKSVSFGVRATGAFHAYGIHAEKADILTDYRRLEAAAFCAYDFLPAFSAVGGIGFGMVWSYVEMSYEYGPPHETGSIDPLFSAFLEARYLYGERVTLGIGAEFMNAMYAGKNIGCLLPEISVGWKF